MRPEYSHEVEDDVVGVEVLADGHEVRVVAGRGSVATRVVLTVARVDRDVLAPNHHLRLQLRTWTIRITKLRSVYTRRQ